MKVLILGINGFIGNALAGAALKQKDWEVIGMDLSDNNLSEILSDDRFHFKKGDIKIDKAWIEEQIKQCDAVLPLVAIATPATYISDPLKVFELDFEANLWIVRKAFEYGKRVVFPSTSEVYGLSPDIPFNEENSRLTLGPVTKPRWIYSCCKQLMDRVILAYAQKDPNTQFSIFRPFNWTGPKLDSIDNPRSRVLTQFIRNILKGEDISLVDGGGQRRCFIYLDDAIDALLRIIENKNNCADGHIFNIGNPYNDLSIRELAELVIRKVKNFPKYKALAEKVRLVDVPGEKYYGKGYQDMSKRVPDISNAKKYLGWEPTTGMEALIDKTLPYYLEKK